MIYPPSEKEGEVDPELLVQERNENLERRCFLLLFSV
jgi:hypothetical protein